MEQTNLKPKTFWERPEGKTGTIVGLGLIAGAGYLLYKILPFLVSMAQNTLYLAGMLLVLGAIIYMVLDPKTLSGICINRLCDG